MKDIIPDYIQELDNLDESERLDFAIHEMELLCKSRCVNVPLTANVKVVHIDAKEEPAE